MEKYYKKQGIVDQSEWEGFLDKLRTPLPISFRINSFRNNMEDIKALLSQKYFNQLQDVRIDGEKIPPPIPIEFYPDELAWGYSASRHQIKKSELFKEFHSFLVSESEVGNITRQETVSMIPPLFLEVEPHHIVLDLCAAPGSKTGQIVEKMHTGQKYGRNPSGMVIANDVDPKRAYMLVHQMRKLVSPCLLISNHDASMFPSLYLNKDDGSKELLNFDRILADVPCSGDGTMRKNQMIWKNWNTANGLGLHSTQVKILVRAFNLAKPGARIVYSTCTMNPVENEAVIAELLRRYNGKIKLLDMSGKFQALKRRPGLTSWIPMDKNGEWIENKDDLGQNYPKSILPPSSEELNYMNLSCCMRILPQDQNTGAFFVAVLEKQKNTNEEECGVVVDAIEKHGFKEKPFLELSSESNIIQEFMNHYEVSGDFPENDFMVRSDKGDFRNAYLVSPLIRNLIKSNEKNLKIINCGVNAFCKHSMSNSSGIDPTTICTSRVHNEVLPLIYPYIKNCARLVKICLDDLLTAIKKDYPFFSEFTKKTETALLGVSAGGMIFIYDPKDDDNSDFQPEIPLKSPIMLSIWRSRMSINVLLDKKARFSLLMRLLGVSEAHENLKDSNKSCIQKKETKSADNAGK